MINEQQQKALREPFPDGEIGKLPRLFCKDCRELARQYKACGQHRMEKCRECGQKHSTASLHLDYVGHAETTDRLLSVDPEWSWEPMVIGPSGPAVDSLGGMWIRLTIGGTTRIGYGHAGDKKGGDAIKEVIGDAIRNAAMRFGVALDLWRKTDRVEQQADQAVDDPPPPAASKPTTLEPFSAVRSRLSEIAREKAIVLADEFYIWSEGKAITDADVGTLQKFAESLAPEKTTRVRRSA